MLRIVRTATTRELWLGKRRLFLATIADSSSEWGTVSEEYAEREMAKCAEEWKDAGSDEG